MTNSSPKMTGRQKRRSESGAQVELPAAPGVFAFGREADFYGEASR